MRAFVKLIAGVAVVLLLYWGIDLIDDILTVPYTSWREAVDVFFYLVCLLGILAWFALDGGEKAN